mmetsp:Transcript_11138/g.68594  ORF Transcript_11138/g.68594 Transcript_11138/m.68594 type:complete len:83 (-) Transcript_11138:3603-3851(-)
MFVSINNSHKARYKRTIALLILCKGEKNTILAFLGRTEHRWVWRLTGYRTWCSVPLRPISIARRALLKHHEAFMWPHVRSLF